jgi:hypothetical protein
LTPVGLYWHKRCLNALNGEEITMTQIHTIHVGHMDHPAIIIGVLLVLYFAYCYCLKRIVEKCGAEPGLLIWIPLFNIIRLLQAGGLSGWLFILFFIPVVNLVVSCYMWVKICQARGKSGWLVIMIFIPLLDLFFIPYLAFSE